MITVIPCLHHLLSLSSDDYSTSETHSAGLSLIVASITISPPIEKPLQLNTGYNLKQALSHTELFFNMGSEVTYLN